MNGQIVNGQTVNRQATEPYREFLATADLGHWQDCLARGMRRLRSPGGATSAELAEALGMAVYVSWLGRSSGATAAMDAADHDYRELRAELDRRTATEPALNLCWGIVLAYEGYRVAGAARLERNGRMAPEHRLLVLPRAPVRTAAVLRHEFADPAHGGFLPAAHFYGTALSLLGAVHEARDLVVRLDPEGTQPLLLDVLGGVEERLGQWSRADAVYRRSTWPAHRYRAAMVAAIAGSSPGRIDLELDEATLTSAGELEGDLDDAEVTRSVAFTNACLWQPVRSWVVELELGKLNHRRRRYAEADLHFRRALASAPESARFLVSRLRFYAYTWLTGTDAYLSVSMQPEALTAGRAALALSTTADETGVIRVWIANNSGDLALIPASVDGFELSARGDAFDAVNEPARALDSWLDTLRSGYHPRSAYRILRYLQDAGFTRAAGRLAGLVRRESHDDFPALLELAEQLTGVGSASGPGDPDRELAETVEAVRSRLVELSELEFKNAIRACSLLRQEDKLDLAEQLLQRLAKQAEGVSELLQVALLRRGSPMTAQFREEGLRCLRRASLEARDTSERLQIAREYFHYGQISEARAMLRDERVLDGGQPLSHADAVVVLQCAAWLSAGELTGVADRAAERLLADDRAGALGPDKAAYARRLVEVAKAVGSPMDPLSMRLADRLRVLLDASARSAWPGEVDAGWPVMSRHLDADAEDVEARARVSLAEVAGPQATFGVRLTAVRHLRSMLTSAVQASRRVSIQIPAEQSPVTDGEDRGDGPRPIELRDLWRARLTPQPEKDKTRQADAALRAFLAEEAQLRDQCARLRREAAAPSARRGLRTGAALLELLPLVLGAAERAEPHPVLQELFAAAADDVDALIAEVSEQVTGLRGGVPPAAGGDQR